MSCLIQPCEVEFERVIGRLRAEFVPGADVLPGTDRGAELFGACTRGRIVDVDLVLLCDLLTLCAKALPSHSVQFLVGPGMTADSSAILRIGPRDSDESHSDDVHQRRGLAKGRAFRFSRTSVVEELPDPAAVIDEQVYAPAACTAH